jgi:hypothetical protein
MVTSTLRKTVLALIFVCGLAGTAFATGPVQVFSNWAKGDMGDAHNTSGSQYIGCWLNSDTVGPALLYCEANDGIGNVNYCYTENSNITSLAHSLQLSSDISFAWDTNHGCTWVTITNYSQPPARHY